jgi:hypothetical protein
MLHKTHLDNNLAGHDESFSVGSSDGWIAPPEDLLDLSSCHVVNAISSVEPHN